MLGLDHRTFDFMHSADCPCCRAKFDNTLLNWSMDALDLALRVKEDGPLGDPFLEFELTVAGVLAQRAEDFLPHAEAIMQKPFHVPRATNDTNVEAVFKKANTKNWTKYTARIEEVVSAAQDALAAWNNSPLTTDQENTIKYALEDAMAAGVAYTSAKVTETELAAAIRFRIINGMMKAAKYYSNEFFNTQVMPALVTAVEKAVATPGDNLIYTVVQEVLFDRLKTVPYWRVVANAAASRSYHYGVIKTAQIAGRSSYQFLAIIDERTSDICKMMNGTTWQITDAVALVERIADADPEEVKTIAPWLTADDIAPYLNDQRKMVEMGVILPPLHGNCRSSIVVV